MIERFLRCFLYYASAFLNLPKQRRFKWFSASSIHNPFSTLASLTHSIPIELPRYSRLPDAIDEHIDIVPVQMRNIFLGVVQDSSCDLIVCFWRGTLPHTAIEATGTRTCTWWRRACADLRWIVWYLLMMLPPYSEGHTLGSKSNSCYRNQT